MTEAPSDPTRSAVDRQLDQAALERKVVEAAEIWADNLSSMDAYETLLEAADRLKAFKCPTTRRAVSLPHAVPTAAGPDPDSGPAASLDKDPPAADDMRRGGFRLGGDPKRD